MKLRLTQRLQDILVKELIRDAYFGRMNRKLIKLLPDSACVQRFFFLLELYGHNVIDPVIPTPFTKVPNEFIEELKTTHNVPESEIDSIVKQCKTIVKDTYNAFINNKNEYTVSKLHLNNDHTVLDIEYIIKFAEVPKGQKPVSTVPKLFKRTFKGNFARMLNRMPAKISLTEKVVRLYICVLRYSYIVNVNVGMQMALPGDCFKVLQSKLGIYTECFASPLNVDTGTKQFYSRFPDTDFLFGSLGRFEDINPDDKCYSKQNNCFEVNPPFTEWHIEMAINKVNSLLNSKNKFLCVVILPAWDDMKVIRDLGTGKYSQGYYYLPAKETKIKPVKNAKVITGPFYYENGMAVIHEEMPRINMKKDSIVIVVSNFDAGWTPAVEKEFFDNFRIKVK